MTAKEEAQQLKKDSVQKFKLKDTIKLEILTPEQKRVKATNEVKDLITDTFRRFKKRNKMDWFTVYMNAYTEVFDPHTNYYSPKNKEDFDTQFKGKVIGIGAIIPVSYTHLDVYKRQPSESAVSSASSLLSMLLK